MDSGKKEQLQKGEILITQGEVPGFIPFLQKGILEILSAPSEYDGLDSDIICSKSKRVGIIKAESLVAGLNQPAGGPYKKSVRALEDSVITRYPLRDGDIISVGASRTIRKP